MWRHTVVWFPLHMHIHGACLCLYCSSIAVPAQLPGIGTPSAACFPWCTWHVTLARRPGTGMGFLVHVAPVRFYMIILIFDPAVSCAALRLCVLPVQLWRSLPAPRIFRSGGMPMRVARIPIGASGTRRRRKIASLSTSKRNRTRMVL